MSKQIINANQLLDQASQFILDPVGPFVLRRWQGDEAKDKVLWVISDIWSYTQFLNKEGEWVNKEDNDAWRNSVIWTETVSAANFYYSWRSRFYWIYVKGAGDRQWYHQFYSKSLEAAEEEYKNFQSKKSGLHWMFVGPDRKVIREDVGKEKQPWIEYPLVT